jgi:hypothetical protein
MNELLYKIIELKENIIKQINESELPAIMLKPIFQDILEQLKQLEIEQSNQIKNNKLVQERQKQIEELQKEIQELKGGK